METRKFSMHSQLLFYVIQRQAGTLAKAILEGVMNAVDARAKQCSVTLDSQTLTIVDDGAGFRSKKEIIKFFEVFGQLHEENESKIYGTFRIGRGQLFSYGINKWRTGFYSMAVDIKNNGLNYELNRESEKVKGCHVGVDLYDELSLSEVAETARILEKWCKWAPCNVTINGKQVNKDPEKAVWSHKLDSAYVNLDNSFNLAVYNLGIHVMDIPKYRYGCGGEVVSRKQLRVNLARNDVQSDCPIWIEVKKIIDKKSQEKNLKKKYLDKQERLSLQRKASEGTISWEDIKNVKLITAVTGRNYAVKAIAKHSRAVATAASGDRIGDYIHRRKMAFVIAEECLTGFNCVSIEAFIYWYNDIKDKWTPELLAVSLAELSSGLNKTYILLDEAELKPNELVWLKMLNMAKFYLDVPDRKDYGGSNSELPNRHVHIGDSPHAMAWTDGKTYVAFSRKFLGTLKIDLDGLIMLGSVYLHECCHQDDDLGSHVHDQEFYERYEEHNGKFMTSFVKRCMATLPQIMDRVRRKLNQKQLCDMDKLNKVKDSRLKFVAAVAASKEIGDANHKG